MRDRLRNLSSLQFVLVRGMQGLSGEPFWSPDSKSVAFGTTALYKIRLPDGAPEEIAVIPGPTRGGSWSADGTILLATGSEIGFQLFVLSPVGAFKELTVPGLPPGNFFHPEFLPNGSDFVFVHRPAGSLEGAIYLATLKNGRVVNPTRLLQNNTAVHYTPAGGGQLLFVRNDSLYSQRLDLSARKLDGDPELIQQGVASEQANAIAAFSVSRTGVVVWRPGMQAYSEVTSFDRQGRSVGTSGSRETVSMLRLSPDETRLIVRGGVGNGSKLLERDRPGSSGLGGDVWDVWTPDSTRLLGPQNGKIVERSAGGPGEIRPVADAPGISFLEDLSPDSKVALYSVLQGGVRSVFSVRLGASSGSPIAVVQTGEQIFTPRFSPDGHWVVYTAIKNGRDIYVQPFPGPGLRRHIVSHGGYPVWRGDGKEIVYLSVSPKEDWVSSIPVTGSGSDIRFGAPVELFRVRSGPNLILSRNPLAVTSDGSRIFFPQAPELPKAPDVIHVKFGWGSQKP
jgi:Tol biopolymer transport system component